MPNAVLSSLLVVSHLILLTAIMITLINTFGSFCTNRLSNFTKVTQQSDSRVWALVTVVDQVCWVDGTLGAILFPSPLCIFDL